MSEDKKLEGLADYLAIIEREEALAEFKKEQDIPTYKAQAEFHNCKARAIALLKPGRVRKEKFLALAIAYHREEKKEHNEKHSEEIAILEKQLSTEDAEAARGWWRS
jgi:hypothetical protein